MPRPNKQPQNAPIGSASRTRIAILALCAVLALTVLVGIGRVYAMNGTWNEQAPTGTAGIDADALRDFEDQLIEAFLSDDVDSLSTMAAASFRYSEWGGESRVIAPDELIDEIDTVLVGPAPSPVYLEEIGIDEIEGIVAEDPLLLWGDDLPVVSVLLVSGLTETGAGEALLGIAPDDDGAPVWVGMLVADEGLPAAPATEEDAADENETDAAATDDAATDEVATEEEEAEEVATDEVAAEDAADTPAAESLLLGTAPAVLSQPGLLDESGAADFLVRAEAGEALTIDLSASADANFSVVGERNQQPYKTLENPARIWTLTVPASQEYRIHVESEPGAEFVLSLLLSPVAHRLPGSAESEAVTEESDEAVEDEAAEVIEEPVVEEPVEEEEEEALVTGDWPAIDPVTNPVRLQVPLGSTSTSTTDILSIYGADGYLLAAEAGQRMVVTVTSPDDIARFAIVGYEDGALLKPLDDQVSWSGILPSTQDYLVQVENPRGVRVQYTLDVEFSALAAVPPTSPVPTSEPAPAAQRIEFPAGAISATVNGSLAETESQTYVLAANEGQSMTVVITSSSGDVGLSIVGEDGTPYKRASVGGAGFSFTLPLTQDYYISAVGQGQASEYSLSVIIVN